MIRPIVFAAGLCTRMGARKALMSIDDVPALSAVLRTIRSAGLQSPIVVLGHDDATIRADVDLAACQVLVNEHPERGLSSSMQLALAAIDEAVTGILTFHVDMPYVAVSTVRAVVRAVDEGAMLAAPTYASERGFPVFFHKMFLDALADSLQGDSGGRQFLADHSKELVRVPVEDPGCVFDIDRPSDLTAWKRSTPMRYQRVANEQELLNGLSQPDAVILCGGTDVMIKLRTGTIQPDILLDVSQVDSMRGIRVEDSALLIGAATAESEIIASPLVHQHVPLLASVLKQLGSVQIRNRGSLGGNIVNASPAADSAIPLLLYDTALLLVGPNSERWVQLEDFFTGPGRTALKPGEFIRTLRLPIPDAGFRSFFHKVGKRNALTIAIASLGVLVRLDSDILQDVRIAVGSVAPTPKRLRNIEAELTGRKLEAATVAAARDLIVSAISPISDVRASADYRKNVIGDLLVRALRSRAIGCG